MKQSLFILFLAVLSVVGCSTAKNIAPTKMSELRPTLPGTQVIEKSIPRQVIGEAGAQEDLNRAVRVIEAFASASITENFVPEYRLFSIAPLSVLGIIGLEDADVLVAADGYIVRSARGFKSYVSVLPTLEGGSIEVRRQGKPMIFKFSFTE